MGIASGPPNPPIVGAKGSLLAPVSFLALGNRAIGKPAHCNGSLVTLASPHAPASASSAGALTGPDFCLIFAPSKGYNEPEILPSSIH